MENIIAHHILTKVHGSYLIQKTKKKATSPLLVGFHGYGETAEDHIQLLLNIPRIENWTLCSIQALHPFYNTRGKIGYCWMTSQYREFHINDNINYTNSVISEVKKSYPVNDTIVFHGFSQGTAMACRASLLGKFKSSGVILLGGDIPPEFNNLDNMQRILLARGKKDKFYSSVRWKKDVARVKDSNIEFFVSEFDGRHEGHADYYKAVGKFLEYYK